MKKWAFLALLLLVAGCSSPQIKVDGKKLKSQQKQRVQSGNEQLKEQTGVEPEMTKRKTTLGIPTAPTE